ncbi:FtsW/RodA/SpoVE family cell cycle protein [Holospora curviuscula]|uniref:Probable peptidoglycan glycosyltransferase FtsW n=1 Tax=Holospora curviuscula TaxID=1082868 RepID=A0A2S5R817_9PROT|nr:FtsW/RodA/SpoVE family cell cycle protein [Holospora curviuscula]PPE03322.1 Lipid II flippase FtsW [Holospora curviuscula]
MTPNSPPKKQDSKQPGGAWAFWWNAIDRWILICSIMLIVLGSWLILAASPSIAAQHGWTTFVLLKRHLVFVAIGITLLLLGSFLRKEHLKTTVYTVGTVAWAGLWGVILFGTHIKGAKRWLNIFGMSLQPSEFIKPAFCMGCAYFLSEYSQPYTNLRFFKVFLLFMIVACPLLLQPDLGTIFLLLMSSLTQSFIAGLGWGWVVGTLGLGLCSLIPIIICFPHAALRMRMFLGYESSDPFGKQYQILQSLKSFASGGLWGKGPGSGVVLDHLPDGHADFIFAVAGEEFGLVACLGILVLYAVIIFRGLNAALRGLHLEPVLLVSGLSIYFMYQVYLNIACVLHLAPTKGITLPFLSYGGSSLLSACWTVSIILCLTRRYHKLL